MEGKVGKKRWQWSLELKFGIEVRRDDWEKSLEGKSKMEGLRFEGKFGTEGCEGRLKGKFGMEGSNGRLEGKVGKESLEWSLESEFGKVGGEGCKGRLGGRELGRLGGNIGRVSWKGSLQWKV